MKTSCELEKKLKKLPDYLEDDEFCYDLRITKIKDKVDNKDYWAIEYVDGLTGNTLLSVEHTSIQATVDTMLSQIKNL